MQKIVKAKTAKVKNSKFESGEVIVEEGAIVTDVYIKAKKITISKNSVLTGCKLFSEGCVSVGKDTIIKERTIINAFKGINIGDRTTIDRDVMIGGMQSEKSEIKIGNDCVLLYRSYLNTTRKISIGNNVGIGGYSLIFTHSSWQNVLTGNMYKFADVMIEDNVWLPWHVLVFPGVDIKKDVTIGGGSVVTKSLPPGVFAAGVPARIIRKKKIKTISIKEKDNIVTEILKDFVGYAKGFLKLKISESKISEDHIIKNKNSELVYSPECKNVQENKVVISFVLSNKIKQKNQWIELDSLTSNTSDELAKHFISFVRRYGIRIRIV